MPAPDQRAAVRGRADSRRGGRRRDHRRRSDRADRPRSRAAALRGRSAREPAARRPQRRGSTATSGRRRAADPTRRRPLRPIKWTDEDFAARRRGAAADGRGARRVDLRRSRRRVQGRRAGPRRNLRRPGHEPSDDGNAQRDGLLAERQAVSARLDAERRSARVRRRRELGRASIRPTSCSSREYTGGGFGSKGPGAVSMAIPALLLEEDERAGDDAHQPRGRALHRPRAHEHDRAREGGLPQGRPHPGARPVHRAGQRRYGHAGDHRSAATRDLAPLPAGSDALARGQRLDEHADAHSSSGRPGEMQGIGIVEPAITKAAKQLGLDQVAIRTINAPEGKAPFGPPQPKTAGAGT